MPTQILRPTFWRRTRRAFVLSKAASAAGAMTAHSAGSASLYGGLGGSGVLSGQGTSTVFEYGTLLGSGVLDGVSGANSFEFGDLDGIAVLTSNLPGSAVTYAGISAGGVLSGISSGQEAGQGSLLGAGALDGRSFSVAIEYGNLVISGGELVGRSAGVNISFAGPGASGVLSGRGVGQESGYAGLLGAGALNGRGISSVVLFGDAQGLISTTAQIFGRIYAYALARGRLRKPRVAFLENDVRYSVAAPGVSDGVNQEIPWEEGEGGVSENDLRYMGGHL